MFRNLSVGCIMWNLEDIMFLCCAWVCLCVVCFIGCRGCCEYGGGRQMGLLCADSSAPSLLTSLHLAPCIVRAVVWVCEALWCDIEHVVKDSRPAH